MDIPSGEREYLPIVLDEFERILDKVKERSDTSSLSAKSADLRAYLQSQLDIQRSSIVKAYKYIAAFRKYLSGDIVKSEENHLATALSIGFLVGHSLKMDALRLKKFQEILASTIGRKNVQRGRRDQNEARKQRLVAQAKGKWATGSLLLHNEMADELLEGNSEEARHISKAVLMAALKPIAAQYDKVRGVKGVRKEKLPPQ